MTGREAIRIVAQAPAQEVSRLTRAADATLRLVAKWRAADQREFDGVAEAAGIAPGMRPGAIEPVVMVEQIARLLTEDWRGVRDIAEQLRLPPAQVRRSLARAARSAGGILQRRRNGAGHLEWLIAMPRRMAEGT